MNSRNIATIVFLCVFGSGMFGFLLGKVVPDRHLDNDSKDIVKLSTGLIATLAALALGLLVSSAKATFDQANHEVRQLAIRTVMLDRVLAQYGPETRETRALLKSRFTTATARLISGDESQQAQLDTPEAVSRFEGIQAALRALNPQNESQRSLQARAIEISTEMTSSRWLLLMDRNGSISTPMLIVMVFWLSTVFAAWGVFSPRNVVVATALLVCALSVAGATLLILEMDRPLTGWIRISPTPVQEAITHLGE